MMWLTFSLALKTAPPFLGEAMGGTEAGEIGAAAAAAVAVAVAVADSC